MLNKERVGSSKIAEKTEPVDNDVMAPVSDEDVEVDNKRV